MARARFPLLVLKGGLIGRLVKMFGEITLTRTGILLTAASLASLPVSNNPALLLVAYAGLSLGSGFASPPGGLASQLINRSWQGHALEVMQSAGSTGHLLGDQWPKPFQLNLASSRSR